MMYTEHGHFIPGSEKKGHDQKPDMVARCGGVGLCNRCALEATVRIKDSGEVPYLVERVNPTSEAMQFGPSYVAAENCRNWLANLGFDVAVEGELEVLCVGRTVETQISAALGWWVVVEDEKPQVFTEEQFWEKYRTQEPVYK